MNTETSKVMFALLRSAVCGGLLSSEEISLYSPDMLPEITSLAQKHDVIHLIVFALKKNGLLDEGDKNLESKILIAVYRLEKLNYELTKLCETLEQAEIRLYRSKVLFYGGIIPNRGCGQAVTLTFLFTQKICKRRLHILPITSDTDVNRKILTTFLCLHKVAYILRCIMISWKMAGSIPLRKY